MKRLLIFILLGILIILGARYVVSFFPSVNQENLIANL